MPLERCREAILSGVTTLLGLALEFCSLQEQAQFRVSRSVEVELCRVVSKIVEVSRK